jgi:hypothetical protein
MLFPGSRYLRAGTTTITLPAGVLVAIVKVPLPNAGPVLGFYRRTEDQRLDVIAARYLADATTFWQLCDANGAIVPDALGARALVGIPRRST